MNCHMTLFQRTHCGDPLWEKEKEGDETDDEETEEGQVDYVHGEG